MENEEEIEKKDDDNLPEEVEESVVHKVETVSDGSNHKHKWIPDFIDSEGKQHFSCSSCWSGIYKVIK